MVCKILGLFLKTLNAGLNYSLLSRENLKNPIHMQLSQKKKLFSELLSAILKSKLIFEHFLKKMPIIADAFPKLWTPKNAVI